MSELERVVRLFLKKRGWSTWYNENYWVHPKCVEDGTRQDYTRYGMSIESALIHEVEEFPPFSASFGMSEISMALHDTSKIKDKLKYYFDKESQ